MNVLKAAQYLTSSLRIGSDNDSFRSPEGALDRALYRAVQQNEAPEWLSKSLHFAKTRVGLRCVELEEILGEAQSLGLTEAPNPSYLKVVFKATPELASELLAKNLKADVDAAKEFGRTLWGYLKEESIVSEGTGSDSF